MKTPTIVNDKVIIKLTLHNYSRIKLLNIDIKHSESIFLGFLSSILLIISAVLFTTEYFEAGVIIMIFSGGLFSLFLISFKDKGTVLFIALLSFILNTVLYTNINILKVNNFIINTIILVWYFILFTFIPLVMFNVQSLIVRKFPKIPFMLEPLNNEEIKREDSIIIDVLGFIQSILIVKFFIGNMFIYQIIAILGLLIFILIRAIAIIKDSSKYRWISSLIFTTLISFDIYMLSNNYVANSGVLSTASQITNLDVEVMFIIIFLYLYIVLLMIFFDTLKNRYLRPNVIK